MLSVPCCTQVVTHKTYRSPTTQKLKPVPDRARVKMVEPLDLTSPKRPRHEGCESATGPSISEAAPQTVSCLNHPCNYRKLYEEILLMILIRLYTHETYKTVSKLSSNPQPAPSTATSQDLASSPGPFSPASPAESPAYDRRTDAFTYSPDQYRYIKVELIKLRSELFPRGHFFGDKRPESVQKEYVEKQNP